MRRETWSLAVVEYRDTVKFVACVESETIQDVRLGIRKGCEFRFEIFDLLVDFLTLLLRLLFDLPPLFVFHRHRRSRADARAAIGFLLSS